MKTAIAASASSWRRSPRSPVSRSNSSSRAVASCVAEPSRRLATGACTASRLVFEDFFLPLSALVGGDEWLNRGFYLQMGGFSVGRLQTAGRAVGVMDAALADSLAYAIERHVFGRAIAHHQLPAVMLGRMATRLTAARQLSYRAARRLRHGADQPEASLAKLYSSKMAESVTRDAMQVFGGMGYAEETNVSRYFWTRGS